MITLKQWLDRVNLTNLKFNVGVLEAEFSPLSVDRRAAWEMYVELLTRVTTQDLMPDEGDEVKALESICSIFSTTRSILKTNVRCTEFAKIAILVLNQVVRPFTAKWHRKSVAGVFRDANQCEAFRKDLIGIQKQLRKYTQALADLADVEDLTAIAPRPRWETKE